MRVPEALPQPLLLAVTVLEPIDDQLSEMVFEVDVPDPPDVVQVQPLAAGEQLTALAVYPRLAPSRPLVGPLTEMTGGCGSLMMSWLWMSVLVSAPRVTRSVGLKAPLVA